MPNTTIFTTIFRGLDQEALDALRTLAIEREYPAETVLCHQGVREHTFYVVVEGRVAVVRRLADGEEQLLNFLGPRSYFGEMALIDDLPRIADCITVMPTRVLEITEEIFDTILYNSPAIANAIMRKVASDLRMMDQQAIVDLQRKNEELQAAYEELQEAQEALVGKERLEHELEIAADVQRGLLPQSLPTFINYDFEAYLRPAREVGGDFYDVIELDDDRVGILLADVADKSVQAALFMAMTRTLFWVASHHSLSPAAVAEEVHEAMLDISEQSDMFVTAFYGVLERSTGRLTYANAGHERPLLLHPDGSLTTLQSRGRFLGMIEGLSLNEYQVDLRPGHRLVVFSDGVVDALDRRGEQFGHERLGRLLLRQTGRSAGTIAKALADDLDAWADAGAQFDDITFLVVEAR